MNQDNPQFHKSATHKVPVDGIESMPDLDVAGIVRDLNHRGVRYVTIGGIRRPQVRDLPVPATVDIDVTPARSRGRA